MALPGCPSRRAGGGRHVVRGELRPYLEPRKRMLPTVSSWRGRGGSGILQRLLQEGPLPEINGRGSRGVSLPPLTARSSAAGPQQGARLLACEALAQRSHVKPTDFTPDFMGQVPCPTHSNGCSEGFSKQLKSRGPKAQSWDLSAGCVGLCFLSLPMPAPHLPPVENWTLVSRGFGSFPAPPLTGCVIPGGFGPP